jgi:aminoglycoside phosphotransferase (APT) family kinase protein
MYTQKFQPDEMDISAELAARLVAEQFPRWSGQRVRPVERQGTWCVNYRLGGSMVIRLPRVLGWGLGPVLENGILARMAPYLPVEVPELLGLGRPTAEYPSTWGVLRWIDGDITGEGQLTEPVLFAADLAAFLRALRKVDLPDRPPAYRGRPLAALHHETITAINQAGGLIDTGTAAAIWEQALALPGWDGPDTWIHSDLMPGNLMTRSGRLSAVIDFDGACIGDPSEDLTVAWMVLPAQVRPAFRNAVAVDNATWLRGRARALSGAIGGLLYYGNGLNQAMHDNAARTIREVLNDCHSSREHDR